MQTAKINIIISGNPCFIVIVTEKKTHDLLFINMLHTKRHLQQVADAVFAFMSSRGFILEPFLLDKHFA